VQKSNSHCALCKNVGFCNPSHLTLT